MKKMFLLLDTTDDLTNALITTLTQKKVIISEMGRRKGQRWFCLCFI